MAFSSEAFQEEMQKLEQEFTNFVDIGSSNGRVRETDVPALLQIIAKMIGANNMLLSKTLEEGADSVFEFTTYTAEGGSASLAIGDIIFDPVKGIVTLVDGTKQRMSAIPRKKIGSVMLFTDVVPTVNINGSQAFKFNENVGWTHIKGNIEKLTLSYSYPAHVQAVFASSHKQLFDFPKTTRMTRVAEMTTVNSFTNVDWTPIATGGVVLAVADRFARLLTSNIGRKTFMVVNKDSANSIDINLQGRLATVAPWTDFADDSTTGASLAVAAGNIQILDVSKMWFEMRLRARSTAAGSPADIEATYLGHIGTGQ